MSTHTEPTRSGGTASAALRVTEVSKTYPGSSTPALDNVSMTLRAGELLAVLGPSGSGKSTLLRAIAGLESLDSGSVEAQPAHDRVAVVFQSPGLFPWLSVRENVALGGRYKRNRDRFDHDAVEDLLGVLGLAGLADVPVTELSGGQAQRVAVGRALAVRPDVVLLDEPFSALDPATREDLQVWLRNVARELNLTIFLVTHDVAEAVALGDRIGFFGGPQGFSREWVPARDGTTVEEIVAYYRNGGDVPGSWVI
ncbi:MULTISPECIES: ABC transporter ATP-binding protein [Kocuria]|uniref:ATP-binding cassette domain-containing protein n=1 Tax=Kocuria subflava TaxID=1736139 RepID=A0A846TLK4_9MICC|nr:MULTISPECIES: ATP-binding cassette domain-containing protein [Kocuria]NKE09323.1 ATP-binding cassette domain-containing protein [Kocuria subflava]